MIHVGIAFDQNYLSPFIALITSIFKNNKIAPLTIHAIITGVDDSIKKEIDNYVQKNNAQLHFYTINEEAVSKFKLTSKWSSAVYYRLYFPFLIPYSVKRLLYLDTDIIVVNDLTELYNHELNNYPVAAVYDNYVKVAPQLGITQEGDYFNSGVLLIDVEKWKEQQISEKTFAYLTSYPERIKFVDQDGLNAVLINNWKKLDEKYNMMYSLIPEGLSKKALIQYVNDKVIIHFTLQRPWHLLCKNRLRKLYFYYLGASPINNKKISDFSWRKVPNLLKLRLLEFYYDHPQIQNFWRSIKS